MVTASQTYGAELAPPIGRRRFWSTALWPLRAVAAGLGLLDETVLGDVVVRRLDDGAEVLRVPVAGTEEAAHQLITIREQLAELTTDEFDATWSLD